jgi:hypothetical protein
MDSAPFKPSETLPDVPGQDSPLGLGSARVPQRARSPVSAGSGLIRRTRDTWRPAPALPVAFLCFIRTLLLRRSAAAVPELVKAADHRNSVLLLLTLCEKFFAKQEAFLLQVL